MASGFRLPASGFQLSALGSRIPDFGFRLSGFQLSVLGFLLRASGFRIPAFGFRYPAFGGDDGGDEDAKPPKSFSNSGIGQGAPSNPYQMPINPQLIPRLDPQLILS